MQYARLPLTNSIYCSSDSQKDACDISGSGAIKALRYWRKDEIEACQTEHFERPATDNWSTPIRRKMNGMGGVDIMWGAGIGRGLKVKKIELIMCEDDSQQAKMGNGAG